ncbi:Response regulator UvrY [Pseudidiomarina piscicola]|uniref:Response regulator UvrY n=1 Tax=Pseudidiomarina piscicola TaxID=2614830 RepID=A0A6S6WTL4_9GAMM|nr:LuxR C-terminal-related transcriptional regulator [Pseudidiomarina piscicola]CAB0150000.1 Response regulator UvrY [Pseudidiomarina piscicola]VZT39447.1 Response regulator UvrY [Pseudomonas aeruginosa]
MTQFIVAVPSELISQGMTNVLASMESQFNVVAIVFNHQQLREAIQASPYATVILGTSLCGDGTIEIWRRLQRRYCDIQLLLWATRFQDVLDFQCNVERVDGFLLASATLAEFQQACISLSRGRMYVAASVAEYLAKNPARQKQTELLSCLSKREVQVAQMIGQGKRVAEISRLLNISSKTVNTFRYRIFDKLQLSGDVALTHLTIQMGLVEIEPKVPIVLDEEVAGVI